MSSRGSITLGELQGKLLDLLEIKCHRCERHGILNKRLRAEERGDPSDQGHSGVIVYRGKKPGRLPERTKPPR